MLVLAVIAFVVFTWVILPVRGEGISMEPTYESGSLHLVNRLSYARRGPARGDIVAIRVPNTRNVYVKRVVGLPGERIAFENGVLLVNGAPLAEPYVTRRRPWVLEEVTLAEHEYFVVGDNRGMNLRDHTLGRVDAARIIGKVVY